MRLYVIGPVTGREGDNREAFEEARRELEAAGFKAVIPHDVVDAGGDWQLAMRQSIREMLRVRAGRPVHDGVAELPGLFGSRGALRARRLRPAGHPAQDRRGVVRRGGGVVSAPSREDWEMGYDSEPRGCNLGCLLFILAALALDALTVWLAVEAWRLAAGLLA